MNEVIIDARNIIINVTFIWISDNGRVTPQSLLLCELPAPKGLVVNVIKIVADAKITSYW